MNSANSSRNKITKHIEKYYDKKLKYDKDKFIGENGLKQKFLNFKDKTVLKNIIANITIRIRKESEMLKKAYIELYEIYKIRIFSNNKKAYMNIGAKHNFKIDHDVDLFEIYPDLVSSFSYIYNITVDTGFNATDDVFFDDTTIEGHLNGLFKDTRTGFNFDKFNKFNKLSVAYLLECFNKKVFELNPYLFYDEYLKLQKKRLSPYGFDKSKLKKETNTVKKDIKWKKGGALRNGKKQKYSDAKKPQYSDAKKPQYDVNIIQEYNKKIYFNATNMEEYITKKFKEKIKNARIHLNISDRYVHFNVSREELPHWNYADSFDFFRINDYAMIMRPLRDTFKEIVTKKINSWENNANGYVITIDGVRINLTNWYNTALTPKNKKNKYKFIGGSHKLMIDLILLKVALKKGVISYRSITEKSTSFATINNKLSECISDKTQFSKYRDFFLQGILEIFQYRSSYLDNKIKYYTNELGYDEKIAGISKTIQNHFIDYNERKNKNKKTSESSESSESVKSIKINPKIIKLNNYINEIDYKIFMNGDNMTDQHISQWADMRSIILAKIEDYNPE
tara:strand:+ start:4153 stop:5850 length:1698 start_codon:yes stop_codon:yes gene_type:complete